MFPFSIFRRSEQSLTKANTEEIRTTVQRLVRLSTNDYGYYLFMILSVLITTAGLLLESAPVIIGGMIIAPILTPLLGCGLALLLMESKGFIRAVYITVLSSVIAILISAAMTIFTSITNPDAVIINFVPVNIAPVLYFVIAFSSGVAGAYAFVKQHLSSSISGVAVSASLVPPLCTIGIGIALSDSALVVGSFTIFALNVMGIILASCLVFWILGFRSARKLEEEAVERVEQGE